MGFILKTKIPSGRGASAPRAASQKKSRGTRHDLSLYNTVFLLQSLWQNAKWPGKTYSGRYNSPVQAAGSYASLRGVRKPDRSTCWLII